MGNGSSSGGGGAGNNHRRRNHHHHHHPQASPPPQPDNRFVYPSATPYPAPPPLPPPHQQHTYYQYVPPPPSGYYNNPPPPPPMPLPAPYDHPHLRIGGAPHGYPPYCPPLAMQAQAPYVVEHQKAITIKNDVNLRKESLRVVPDENDPGKFLVAFNYDANTPGCITVLFFAKEGSGSNQIPMKENLFKPVTISFKEGLGQKFCQPSGTGIDFSLFEDSELIKEGEMEVYPLVIKAEGLPANNDEKNDSEDQKTTTGNPNSQVTQAVFVKDENGEYHLQAVKQILWVEGTRYELQEIYGIANSVDNDFDGNDPGKECVICLSEPRDTTALPCRHMCMCSECAKVLRLQTNRCPICRQPVERFLEIDVNNGSSSSSSSSSNSRLEEKQVEQPESPPKLSK